MPRGLVSLTDWKSVKFGEMLKAISIQYIFDEIYTAFVFFGNTEKTKNGHFINIYFRSTFYHLFEISREVHE